MSKFSNAIKVALSAYRRSINLAHRCGSVPSATALVQRHQSLLVPVGRCLDLGCGPAIKNPFGAAELCGVDIRADLDRSVRQANLALEPIPFDADSFDYCTAFDFIEHVPRILAVGQATRFAFLELMNEVHRVLKPGGLFLHRTPAYPAKQAFQDPTHVNIITEETFPMYFCDPHNWAAGYGFAGRFELVDQKWEAATWLIALMRAIK